jgi:tetratricopeptide (TPR) repeat protein
MRRFIPVVLMAWSVASAAWAGIRIDAWKGSVSILFKEEPRVWKDVSRARLGIGPGDRLRTGRNSMARVQSDDGTFLDFYPEGEILFGSDDFGMPVLDLSRGSLLGQVNANSLVGLEVRTPFGSVQAAQGKFFVSMLDNGNVLVEAKEGGFLKVRASDGRKADLPAGRKVLLTKRSLVGGFPQEGVKPDSPLSFLPEPRNLPERKKPRKAPGGISELLDAIEEDPDDVEARFDLGRRLSEAVADRSRRFGKIEGNLGREERDGILRKVYFRLAEQIKSEVLQHAFLAGHGAFEEGRYFTAADRFLFCRLLEPGEPWLQGALDDYLSRQIPDRVEARARSMRGEASRQYRAAFSALMLYDWGTAGLAMERAAAAMGRGQGIERAEPAELAGLSEKVKTRHSVEAENKLPQFKFVEASRAAEAGSGGVIEAIERVLLACHGQSRESWWKEAAQGIDRALLNRDIRRMTAEAASLFDSGNLQSSARVLALLLQRSPGNPAALDMLDKIQAGYDQAMQAVLQADANARGVKEPVAPPEGSAPAQAPPSGEKIPASSPPPAEKTIPEPAVPTAEKAASTPVVEAKAPAPPASPVPERVPAAAVAVSPGPVPQAPSREEPPVGLRISVQVDAYYNRGLKAYLRGDLNAAAEEWRSALRLNPRHEPSSRALSRVLKELEVRQTP